MKMQTPDKRFASDTYPTQTFWINFIIKSYARFRKTRASNAFSAIIVSIYNMPQMILLSDVNSVLYQLYETIMWNKLNKSMMFCQAMFGLSFYGVMVILTRFFLEDLGYSEADTMMVVGAFSSIGPLFAIAGGFIADKFLGAYRSLTIAYGTFATGYTLLVLGASTTNVPMSLVGIALASYARGLMLSLIHI